MALNLTNLSEALVEALISNQDLVDFTGHGETDPATKEPSIRIFEAQPSFPADNRYVVFDFLDSNQIQRNAGYHKTKVLIYGLGEDRTAARYLADQVQCMFSIPPLGESVNKWFLDISTDCISNIDTEFLSRPMGGKKTTDQEIDIYIEPVEIDITWKDCPCDNIRCEEVVPEQCELETEIEYDFEDECC